MLSRLYRYELLLRGRDDAQNLVFSLTMFAVVIGSLSQAAIASAAGPAPAGPTLPAADERDGDEARAVHRSGQGDSLLEGGRGRGHRLCHPAGNELPDSRQNSQP